MRNYEKNLLMEAEGLEILLKLLDAIETQLFGFLKEYGDFIDKKVADILKRNVTLLNLLMTKDFTFVSDSGETQVEIKCLVKQLDDVMDEIKVLQAGLPTKEGVPDEGEDDEEEEPDTPPPPPRPKKRR